MLNIKKSYDECLLLFNNQSEITFSIECHESCNDYVKNKTVEFLTKCSKFWNNYLDYQIPLSIVYSTELSYDWLKDKLKENDFIDAMPTQDRINQVGDSNHTGGGGFIYKDEMPVLFFWQVVGTKSDFIKTGSLKTPPHLFAHAVQHYIGNQNGDPSLSKIPAWLIEGQSDYAALMCISENFENFIGHRENFIKDSYVPYGDATRKKIKQWEKEDWFYSLLNSPIDFAGIPLIEEYYSGFFTYELMLSLIGSEKIKYLYLECCKGKEFKDTFEAISGIKLYDFYVEAAEILANQCKNIVVD